MDSSQKNETNNGVVYCFCACATTIALATIAATIIAPNTFKTEAVLAGFGLATGAFGIAGGYARNPTPSKQNVAAQSVETVNIEQEKQ